MRKRAKIIFKAFDFRILFANEHIAEPKNDNVLSPFRLINLN